MQKINDVLGIGNAMMDLLLEVQDSKIFELGLQKGQFNSVEGRESFKAVLDNIHNEPNIKIVSGGSVANTIKGIACLGGDALFCAKVGYDHYGDKYIQELKEHGVITSINRFGPTTGHVLSLITPDAQRTFLGNIGANVHFSKEDILEEDIKESKILHVEGYQFESPAKNTILYALELAKKHGTKISIDLSDPGVIERNKELFKWIVENYVDIIFLNEDEAKIFTGLQGEDALREVAKIVEIAIVKLGKIGSLIYQNNEVSTINGYPANAIDTTGAGDTYAAGFLYGYCNNWPIQKAGELGSLMASKIVEKIGVMVNELNVEEIKRQIMSEKLKVDLEEEKEEITSDPYQETFLKTESQNYKEQEEVQGEVAQGEQVSLKHHDVKIGIIGGSGLDDPQILHDAQDFEVETPYGDTSSPLKVGTIQGIDVVLIARHGRDHSIPPTQVNYRANLYALKEAGCTHILATTACGSLREEIGRGDFIILDQFIDFTRHRKVTFHEEFVNGDVKHTAMATPFCGELRKGLIESAKELGLKYHPKGTVITIEGPRFSTKAESHVFRSWNADVINMSVAPEAILANEIDIPYAAIAMSTDYDCWKEDEEPVTWDAILEIFAQNVEKVTSLLVKTIPKIAGKEVVQPISQEPEEKKTCILKDSIRTIPHWPKEGIMFRDITTLLENPAAFKHAIEKLVTEYKDKGLTKIAGIDSRGFIFGAPLALELGLPFVLIRKKGKLPAETIGATYALEYGFDEIEVHRNSISPGDNVLIVDDLIATGGTALAACNLVEKLGGNVAGLSFVIDLPELNGKEKLARYDVKCLVEFEGH